MKRSICAVSGDEIEFAQAVRQSDNYDRSRLPENLHGDCLRTPHSTGFERIAALLTVCRQIHREAASVPHALNIFNFQFLSVIPTLLARLTPSQCAAIRSISLHLTLPYLPTSRVSTSIKKMTALKELTLFYSAFYLSVARFCVGRIEA